MVEASSLTPPPRRQESSFAFGGDVDVYDWVVDISLLGDLAKEGWQVVFSDKFWNHMIETGHMQQLLLQLLLSSLLLLLLLDGWMD